FMGFFGIAIGLLAIFIHLASLRSFGTPYLSPLAPVRMGDLKDSFIRAPLWTMLKRPKDISWYDPKRQEFKLRPNRPHEKG
ncbi:MAG TPA: spore germination protein, partial [Clostridia bacterium]|nr:spore germination protein [Clostridia bacterium]